MGELGRYGPQLPQHEAAQREHFKEVDEDLRRDQEADRIAKGRSTRPRWGIGYLVVLLGVAGFVLSCFLPYTAFPGVGEGPSLRTLSYYRLVTFIPGRGNGPLRGRAPVPVRGCRDPRIGRTRWAATWSTRASTDALHSRRRHSGLVVELDRRAHQRVALL
jgi:hypothetical protein